MTKEVKTPAPKAKVDESAKARAAEEAAELKSRGDATQQHPDQTPPVIG